MRRKLGLVGGLGGVAGERALVEALLRRERRLIAEQHVEELESLDMAAEHGEADRHGHGEKQAERAPQPGPEYGRDDDGDRRHAGAVAEHQRLDHLAHGQLAHHEQRQHQEEGRPAGIDGGGDEQGQRRGDKDADIGHEAHQPGEDAPGDRARHADQPQARRRSACRRRS